MNAIAALRQRQRPWVRTVLAALTLVWLNAAMQPCVMAAPMANDPDVAHHGSHGARGDTQHGAHSECLHCEVFGRGDCQDGGDCGALSAIQPNGTATPKDNADKPVALVPTAGTVWQAPSPVRVADIAPRAAPPPPELSLTVRYCVYLK